MKTTPRAYCHQYVFVSLIGLIVASTGCVPADIAGSSSGYQRFTLDEMKQIDQDELRNVQFFTHGPLRLSTGEQETHDSLSTEAGKLMKIQTRQHRTVEIPSRTPGILLEMGNDWIDLDVGEGVVLRFRATEEAGSYECVALNGQPLTAEQPEAAVAVEFEGDQYDVVSTRPVYLEYFVRHIVNVDRASHTIGGKRIDEAGGEVPKKTASRY